MNFLLELDLRFTPAFADWYRHPFFALLSERTPGWSERHTSLAVAAGQAGLTRQFLQWRRDTAAGKFYAKHVAPLFHSESEYPENFDSDDVFEKGVPVSAGEIAELAEDDVRIDLDEEDYIARRLQK